MPYICTTGNAIRTTADPNVEHDCDKSEMYKCSKKSHCHYAQSIATQTDKPRTTIATACKNHIDFHNLNCNGQLK